MVAIFKRFTGMQVFSIMWFGQLISIMGTSMTRYGLMLWAYEQNGKATTLSLLLFFSFLPYILLSPLAGAIVDKFDRKKIMIISDALTGFVTVFLLIMFILGKIELWQLFLAEGLSGIFEAFQIPAYSSSITMLVPKEKYGKTSGMNSLSTNLSKIIAPIFAGLLMICIGIKGIMVIDIFTFVFAVSTLMVVSIPKPIKKIEKHSVKNTILEDIKFGLKYLVSKKGLLYLLIIFTLINLLATITYFGILPAMVLARTQNDKLILAIIQSAIGVGGVVGSIIISIWGIPTRKVKTIFLSCLGSFLLGDIFLGIKASTYIWIIGGFMSAFFLPFLMASENALWRSKVEPSIQGRVFSLKAMIQISTMPIGFIIGGLLADYVFEPAMMYNSFLKNFSFLVGEGKGSGMGLMFIINGILGSAICLFSLFIKDVRNVERDIPDFDAE